jgi:hypothetical protein
VSHQIVAERVASLLGLRLLYETVISLGAARYTVRWGTYRWLVALFTDGPMVVLLTYFLFYGGSVAGFTGASPFGLVVTGFVNPVSLGFVATLVHFSVTMRQMYVQMAFLSRVDTDAGPETDSGSLFSPVFVAANVFLRALTIASTIFLFGPTNGGVAVAGMLLLRLRLLAVYKPDATPLDAVVALLLDCAFAPSADAMRLSSVISAVEAIGYLLIPLALSPSSTSPSVLFPYSSYIEVIFFDEMPARDFGYLVLALLAVVNLTGAVSYNRACAEWVAADDQHAAFRREIETQHRVAAGEEAEPSLLQVLKLWRIAPPPLECAESK